MPCVVCWCKFMKTVQKVKKKKTYVFWVKQEDSEFCSLSQTVYFEPSFLKSRQYA